jgi:hypothetical protein
VLKDHIILCTESISEGKEQVIDEITSTNLNRKAKKLLDINYDEMNEMCGNMIML